MARGIASRAAVLVFGLLLSLPAAARAQEFGLLESAETIDRGTFKLRVNPMFIFGRDGGDDQTGVAATVGYGFTDRFDVEAAAAFYDGVRFLGANAEVWLLRDANRAAAFDLSLIGGVHFARGDNTADTRGFDVTFLGSRRTSERLELYAGLDLAFESITEEGVDFSYTPIHLVPGLEYRLAQDVDFVAEFGLALNDDARHYASAGIAFYFR